MNARVDYKRELGGIYRASAKNVREVVVPALSYLMIDGCGDPNTERAYVEAVEALFSVSYAVKFAVKRAEPAFDYVVMPLEGLWWSDDLSAFDRDARELWNWTMMIMQPQAVSRDLVELAIEKVAAKKQLPGLGRIRFETLEEGRCAQVLHIGPFSEEGPTVRRVHDFINDRGTLRGKHHEIYLSDVRRADPRKWRTILRQGME